MSTTPLCPRRCPQCAQCLPVPLAPTELSRTLGTNCSLLRLQSENWHLVLGKGKGCQWNPKGPNRLEDLPHPPYPPINKVSAPSQGAGTGQEALAEENQGCCLLHVSPHTAPGHGLVPTGPLCWWCSDGAGVSRTTCSHGEIWDGAGAGLPCGQSWSEAARGRLRGGLRWGHCACPRSGPSPGHS